MYRVFRMSLCFVFLFSLFLTLASPSLADESASDYITLSTWNDFVYYVTTTPTGRSYAKIVGYVGNDAEITVPGKIEGVPVEYIDGLRGETAHYPHRLVVSEGVKAIRLLFGEYSTALQEVILPSTLQVMGGSERDRFWSVETEQYVSTGVFADASSLKTLKVPYSVALMSENTFHEGITLQVEAGSYAARWAKANEQPFEIIEHTPSIGDYDADGLTTSTDARLLLQKVAGKIAFTDEQAAVADVDGDGEVTTTDARLALQYAVGKEAVDTLTCPLAFDSPLIPKETATEVTGWVKVPAQSGAPFDYAREPGPLTSPVTVLNHLNACIGKEYHAKPSLAMTYYGAGVSMFVDGIQLYYQQGHCLRYYGLMFTVGTGSQLKDFVMA